MIIGIPAESIMRACLCAQLFVQKEVPMQIGADAVTIPDLEQEQLLALECGLPICVTRRNHNGLSPTASSRFNSALRNAWRAMVASARTQPSHVVKSDDPDATPARDLHYGLQSELEHTFYEVLRSELESQSGCTAQDTLLLMDNGIMPWKIVFRPSGDALRVSLETRLGMRNRMLSEMGGMNYECLQALMRLMFTIIPG